MKRLNVLVYAALIIVVMASCVHAYTDPGTGALIWQLLSAAFVGLMFFWHKFKNWFLYSVLKKKKADEEEE